MEYSITQLSKLAGVSARTLRYYDSIGLLKPLYVNNGGYRFYGEREADLLQQILFYRERGFALEQIKEILYEKEFDLLSALEEHLHALEVQRDRTERLIHTVELTIRSMKGECEMTDQEKFEAFKSEMIQQNEAAYGSEIRERYGEEAVDASNAKLLAMTQEEYSHFRALEEEIRTRLEKAVAAKLSPESDEAEAIVKLHREWLCMTWKSYSPEAHRGVASMYTADERFRKYYDRTQEGCADFLVRAVHHFA